MTPKNSIFFNKTSTFFISFSNISNIQSNSDFQLKIISWNNKVQKLILKKVSGNSNIVSQGMSGKVRENYFQKAVGTLMIVFHFYK